MTQNNEKTLATRVGRKKLFAERITLPLSADMLSKLDASLREGEVRLDMIRGAIAHEIERRANGQSVATHPK